MHNLKIRLPKVAAQLIYSFQVSGEKFSEAWKKRRSIHENERVLISKHLDENFKLNPIISKISKILKSKLP